MDRSAVKAQLSHVRHELVRISSHLEHASTKIEMNNIERAKYFTDWSRKEVTDVIRYLDETEKTLFKEEASNDAVPKQKA